MAGQTLKEFVAGQLRLGGKRIDGASVAAWCEEIADVLGDLDTARLRAAFRDVRQRDAAGALKRAWMVDDVIHAYHRLAPVDRTCRPIVREEWASPPWDGSEGQRGLLARLERGEPSAALWAALADYASYQGCRHYRQWMRAATAGVDLEDKRKRIGASAAKRGGMASLKVAR